MGNTIYMESTDRVNEYINQLQLIIYDDAKKKGNVIVEMDIDHILQTGSCVFRLKYGHFIWHHVYWLR